MAIKIMAERQPPGDRWVLTDEALTGGFEEQVILTSLTACLNEIYKLTGDQIFSIDAVKGVVAVETEKQKGPQVWDLYGERSSRELLND
jgi:hypothetical protein